MRVLMLDSYKRHIHYLRISVTDHCNLQCHYCKPNKVEEKHSPNKMLSFIEIEQLVKNACELGFDKFRLTGGEPLLRKHVVNLVAMLVKIKEVKDLAMTTNGILLDKYALPLKKKGLHRLNISLDTMDPQRYKILTGGELQKVLTGIDAAIKAGFDKIKLNCVIEKSIDEPDSLLVKEYADRKNLEIRYIRRMDMKQGIYYPVNGGVGGNCSQCNRLRVTCDGMIISCLFNDIQFSIRELGCKEALIKAINAKPEQGTKSERHRFYQIGG